MARSSVRNSVKLKLMIPIFILQLLHPEVFSKVCPHHCNCVFSSKELESNKAICHPGNSTVNFGWKFSEGLSTVMVTCKGTDYNCLFMPTFDHNFGINAMIFKSCSPSILKCALYFYETQDTISELWFIKTTGNYTLNDYNKDLSISYYLNELFVETLRIEEGEEESVTRLPANIFQGVNTLNSMELEGNVFEHTHIAPDVFEGLHTLKHLYLNTNKIKSIDPDAFSYIINLETLGIDSNMLAFLPNKLFDKLKKIYQISIVNNLVNITLDTRAFAGLPKQFEIIYIYNSKINALPEDIFSGSSSLQSITFSMNSIEVLPANLFWTTSSLTHIDISYNQIKEFPVKIFFKLKKLRSVDFSYNNIETLNGDLFFFNTELKEVYLQNNNIKHIHLDVFNGIKLEFLSLASNELESIIRHTSSSWELRQLILNDNNLNEFGDWLADLTDLEYLDLSNNKINKIKESLIYTWYSIEINLLNNNITNIEPKSSEMSESSAINSNISIYLSDNPLECDCASNIIIKKWYDRDWVPDFKNIVCKNEENLYKIDVYVECNYDTKEFQLVSIGTKVIASFVLAGIFISIYIRRKQIWEYVNNLCKHNQNNSITNEERQEAIK